MSKKLLAISSSPRTKGNSDSALDMFLDAVKDKFEIEKSPAQVNPVFTVSWMRVLREGWGVYSKGCIYSFDG